MIDPGGQHTPPSSIFEYSSFGLELTIRNKTTIEVCGVLNVEEPYGSYDTKCNNCNVDTALLGHT